MKVKMLVMGAAGALLFSVTTLAQNKPLHEAQTKAAWDAVVQKKFPAAKRHAEDCIDEFRGTARRLQKQIEETGRKIPKGKVKDQATRDAIFKNGPLNDVATCYFILGYVAEKTNRRGEMVDAYVEAMKFTHARCWDEGKKIFWSPAEAAKKRLEDPVAADKAPHEALTGKAWEAFNRRDDKKAIEVADECIKEFYEEAVKLQRQLVMRKVSPPTGSVSEREKAAVFKNGLLNDVATCLFVKGRAAERIGDKKTAIAAYTTATKLDRGRCWDNNGWFWSPAEGAADRLSDLR